MKRFFIALVFSMTTLMSTEITIAVAANVSYVITPLKAAFLATHPDIQLRVILGSSGKLTAQISHGAPYDMLLSADMKYPQKLYDNALATSKPVVYAQGALAILSTKKRGYCAEIYVLEDKNIKKIAIANPKTAPYGIAAAEALRNAKLYAKLKPKFVYGESISQTVAYAITAADIGIVALSSLYAPQMLMYKEAIHWSEVDESLYTPISQGMVILKHAKLNSEVKAFYDFMLSEKAKKILTSFGYRVP
jgi:molybdate transport system substrate-binding protein